jgi:hypothetical protein
MGLRDVAIQVKSLLFHSSGLTVWEQHELALDTSEDADETDDRHR